MKTWTKKAIRELGEVNRLAVHWERNTMVLVDAERQLRIATAEKDNLEVTYFTPEATTEYKIQEAGLFDTFFSFVYNYDRTALSPKYPTITLSMLTEEEPPAKFWQGRIAEALSDNKYSDGVMELGGNRILSSVYRNYLLLEDDLLFYGTNVYKKENEDLQDWLHAHVG